MEQFNANPIGFGVGPTVTPLQTASRNIAPTEIPKPANQNLILENRNWNNIASIKTMRIHIHAEIHK